jgi:diguanylate cyclase (GGDEF)-like protein
MQRAVWSKVIVATVWFAGVVLSASAASLESEVEAVSERVALAPQASVQALTNIQAAHAPLTARQQVLVYEQLSKASFHAGDFAGAVHYANLLEVLGQQSQDKDAECLGILFQSYGHWMLGKIQTAYTLAQRAAQFAPAALSPGTRIKSLLTTAQMQAEEHQPQAALQSAAAAVQLASATTDEALMFMAAKTQAKVALSTNDLALANSAVEQLLSLAVRAPYRERLLVAKKMEFAVASASGDLQRASLAMADSVQWMAQLQLNETLGAVLNDYADLELKRSRFAKAAALSQQALALPAVAANEQASNVAHFNHALALIHLRQIRAGSAEAEQLFQSPLVRAQLREYLSEYISVLSQAGEVTMAARAQARLNQWEKDQALQRVKEEERAQAQLDALARDSQLKALEAAKAHAQRKSWLIAAVCAVAGLIALLYLYGRSRRDNQALAASNRQLCTSSNRDTLTGLFNRRYVDSVVANLARRGNDAGASALAASGLVLLMDIDHFKALNDTHGHAAGDQVLRITAERLSKLFRQEDIVVRWGGEEFLALLPATQAPEAARIAARVLSAVSAQPVDVNGTPVKVTVSVGLCSLGLQLRDRALNWAEVVNLADQALYLAKQNGRNMAYGVTGPLDVTVTQMAVGLRTLREQGKVTLLEVKQRTPAAAVAA